MDRIPISETYLIDNIEYMKNLPDNYFDLTLADPPYGLGESVVNSGGRFKRYHNINSNWDLEIPTKEYFEQLFRTSKNQIIWGGNYFELPPNKCFIIWDKIQPEGVSFAMAEYAYTSFDSVAKIYRYRTQGQEDRFHPTQKPVKLYKWLLANYAKQGDKIFDPNMGSQSSRIAAYDMGFDYWGCELDKEYFDKGNQRFENFKKQLKLL